MRKLLIRILLWLLFVNVNSVYAMGVCPEEGVVVEEVGEDSEPVVGMEDLEEIKQRHTDEEQQRTDEKQRRADLRYILSSYEICDDLDEKYRYDLCNKFYDSKGKVRRTLEAIHKKKILLAKKGPDIPGEVVEGASEIVLMFTNFLAEELKEKKKIGEEENFRANDERERADEANIRAKQSSFWNIGTMVISCIPALIQLGFFIYNQVQSGVCDQ